MKCHVHCVFAPLLLRHVSCCVLSGLLPGQTASVLSGLRFSWITATVLDCFAGESLRSGL